MKSPSTLKHFSKYTNIYFDVDDTILQTTQRLDRCSSEFSIKGKRPNEGRWVDAGSVFKCLEGRLLIPPHRDAMGVLHLLLTNDVKFRLVSAAENHGLGRDNRTRSVLGLPIKFFNNDREKRKWLEKKIISTDLVVDDKPVILEGLGCETLLVNEEFNPKHGISMSKLYYFWGSKQ